MHNQLFRSCMPYVVTLNNQVFTIKNRDYQALFSCNMRKTKPLVELLKSISYGEYHEDSKNGITSYLYATGKIPSLFINGIQTMAYEDYMQRFNQLLLFLEDKYYQIITYREAFD